MEAGACMLPDRGQRLQVRLTGRSPLLPVYALFRQAHAVSNALQWAYSRS